MRRNNNMAQVIYVAGPYTAETDFKRLENIKKADEVTARLWHMGYYAVCPHKITAFYGGLCDEQIFIEGGLEILRRCDAVVLVEGWERSGGTLGEIEVAMELHIPVFGNVYNLIMGDEINYKRAKYYISKWKNRSKSKS
jgi:nucleoside 2-deoxyribosyltransferase